MATIGKRIKKYRTIKGLTQAELARSCGWGASRISNYEAGIRNIDANTAEIIANALDVSPSVLMFGIETEFEYIGKMKNGLINVKGEAIMGIDGGFEMDESFVGYLKFYSSDKNAFALRVKGDSMFPRINSGEFIVLEPEMIPHPGDEVLVKTKKGDNMIKRLEFHRNGFYRFTSINQSHPPITIDENEIDNVIFLGAIVKSNRYLSKNENNDIF